MAHIESSKIHLPKALSNRGTDRFKQALQEELVALDSEYLQLHRATRQGGQVDTSKLQISVLSIKKELNNLLVRVSVFFNEIVGGCNCDDDPVSSPAYCELQVRINGDTGAAQIELIAEV